MPSPLTKRRGAVAVPKQTPGWRRARQATIARISALLSLAAVLLFAVLVVLLLWSNLGYALLILLGLMVLVVSAWSALTRRGAERALALTGVLGGLTVIVIAVVQASDGAGQVAIRLVVLGLVLSVAAVTSRGALVSSFRAMTAVPARHSIAPRHPVLICNPRSGNGKVEKFQLVEQAASMGVETLLLEPGLDLDHLAREAVRRGADCLGMAGGDGSQALVASIAIEHRLPFVCVAAGTRNHFALDLALDRDDPRKGISAFKDRTERRVDYATMNGRLFVNNVSLGVYATIVQQEGYREAKAGTSAALLPELLGRTDRPFDLQFTMPDGREVDGSFLIQISNNPYVLGPSLDLSQRRRLDRGVLGVFAVSAASGIQAAHVVTSSLAGRGGSSKTRHGQLVTFTTNAFEVRSHSGRVYAGVDGEALELPTPLEFRIHPGGLRLLVPHGNLEAALRREARGLDVRRLLSIATHRGSITSAGTTTDPVVDVHPQS